MSPRKKKDEEERDDILADLDDAIEEPAEFEGDEEERDEDLDSEAFEEDHLSDDASDEDEDYETEDDLDDVVGAETEEWPAPEPPTGEEDEVAEEEEDAREQAEEGTLVGIGAEEGLGRLASIRWALGAPFRRIRRMRMPLWARFATGSLAIVAAVAAATVASSLLYLDDLASALNKNGRLNQQLEGFLNVPGSGEAQTILILGSDLRPQFKRVSDFKGLSDTTMLLRLDPNRDAIALFSLPRDLRVEIPGVGVDKLNAAYAFGGPQLTLRTIKNLTRSPSLPEGIEVNHVVNVDFEGFARAVNHVGCVYVDVDRRYLHSNANTTDDYEEINLQPGYQALCGYDALDYARYRHTDNDVVRAARQQDFLREARQKVPATKLFSDRKDLMNIFTKYTTSDIDSGPQMLDLLRLLLESRNAPVKEVHFEGHLGPSYVTASQAEIDRAVNQFLGIEDTPGARGTTAAPDEASGRAEAKRDARQGRPASTQGGGGDANLVGTSYGKELAKGIRAKKIKLPVFYPTELESGSDYAQKPRVYKINGTGEDSPSNSERAAYKWVFSRPALGEEYYGFMGTRWQDPPILNDPSESRTIGDRTYDLFYDGDRLRIVAWHTDEGSFWLSNTLIQSLSNSEMIEIARHMRELPPLRRK